MIKSILSTLPLFILSIQIQAQDIWQLWHAQNFHYFMTPEEKVNTIRDFEIKGWSYTDTLLNLDNSIEIQQIDMTPFINEMGESIYLLTEVSPEFPGGYQAMWDYFRNDLDDVLASGVEDAAQTVFYQFVVNTQGKVVYVAQTQPPPVEVTREVLDRLRKTLENMPDWTPGQYRGRAVNTVLPAVFNLK